MFFKKEYVYITINDKKVKVKEKDIYEKYPEIQKQYGFPNIIVEQTKDEVGQEVIKAYAEGIKGIWYYYLEGRKRVNVEKIKRQYFYTLALFMYRQHQKGSLDRFKINKSEN